jgi:hypothetical protein
MGLPSSSGKKDRNLTCWIRYTELLPTHKSVMLAQQKGRARKESQIEIC